MRLRSLDAFRGLTVAAMILVNNPGDWAHIYAPLEHAPWNGWTPTDLIFPFFLFIVGVSITFALKRPDTSAYSLRKDEAAGEVAKIIRRGLTLFALGFFLNLFPRFDFSSVRIMGVLQRIGLVYIACALIYRKTTSTQQVVLTVLILTSYYLIMTVLPVPGIGYPNLEPETNFAAWVDHTLLTTAHVYRPAKVWDPEGLLSTFPAVATGLLGLLVGRWLQAKNYGSAARESQKALFLFIAGVVLAVLGTLLNPLFPINKALWTSTYVLLAGGLAMCMLAIFYYLIDVRKGFGWNGVLIAFGVNAITVFFLSGLIPRIMNLILLPGPDGSNAKVGMKEYLYKGFIAPHFADPNMASLAGALTFVAIWGCILWIMYKRRVIIKV
ncbi:acyltransferase family protein [uncultured Fibrella sp.]|uniref:acyltransferase family protein n=1 Tax=uncultured Fibrella sp. TaxID=1284596 RepID=UPI0035CC79EC